MLFLSYLIAWGIGFHNLGEGFAVGAAFALGEVSLGTFLVGFTLSEHYGRGGDRARRKTTSVFIIIRHRGAAGRGLPFWEPGFEALPIIR